MIENDSENIIITAINSYHYQYLSGYHHVHLSRSRLQEEGVSEVYSEPGLILKMERFVKIVNGSTALSREVFLQGAPS